MANSATQHRNENGAAGRVSPAPPPWRDAPGTARNDDTAGWVDTLTDSIRNNPMTCLLVGLGLGFVVARMFKR